jgi:hypothetical protein
MPPIADAKFVEARNLQLKANDLQNLSFQFTIPATGGLPILVSKFTPAKTYFCPSIAYSASAGTQPGTFFYYLSASFVPAGVTMQNGASIGTAMLNESAQGINGFRNWQPFGWYLPRDKTIYIHAGGSFLGALIGSVTLYLIETLEQ